MIKNESDLTSPSAHPPKTKNLQHCCPSSHFAPVPCLKKAWMLQKGGPNLRSFLQPWHRGRANQWGSSVQKQPEQAQNNKLDKQITVSLSQRSTCVWIQQRHVNKLSWLPAHPNKTNLSLIILVTAFDSDSKILSLKCCMPFWNHKSFTWWLGDLNIHAVSIGSWLKRILAKLLREGGAHLHKRPAVRPPTRASAPSVQPTSGKVKH